MNGPRRGTGIVVISTSFEVAEDLTTNDFNFVAHSGVQLSEDAALIIS